MTGELAKNKIQSLNISLSEVARRIGMSQQSFNQALNASDIKSGLLEKICSALGVGMSFFYPEEIMVVNNNTNNIHRQSAHNISNGSGSITENSQPNDDIVKMLMEQNAALVKQNAELIALLTKR